MAAPTNSVGAMVILDPDGDVTIILPPVESLSQLPGATKIDESSTLVRCSSKHLSTASCVFRVILQSPFREGSDLLSEGTLRLPLPDDDTEAMFRILAALHCRHHLVRDTKSLDDLFAVALLMDKYNIKEALEPYTQKWANSFRGRVPNLVCLQLSKRIFIYHVFGLHERLTKALTVHCRHSTLENVDAEECLPDRCINIANDVRARTITELLRNANSFMDKYLHCASLCGAKNCNSVVLGTFMRHLAQSGLLPMPEDPFPGYSVEQVFNCLYEFNKDCLDDICPGLTLNWKPPQILPSSQCDKSIADFRHYIYSCHEAFPKMLDDSYTKALIDG